MIKLKYIVRRVILESLSEDVSDINLLAQVIISAAILSPGGLPTNDKDARPLPISKLVKKVSLTGKSKDFKAFVEYLKTSNIQVQFIYDVENNETQGGFDTDESLIMLNVASVPEKALNANYNKAVADFFTKNKILQHELTHLYDHIRITDKVKKGTNASGSTRSGSAASNKTGKRSAEDIISADYEKLQGRSEALSNAEYYSEYRAIPFEIWAHAVQEIVPVLLDSPIKQVLSIAYNQTVRQKVLNKFLEDVLYDNESGNINRPKSIRRSLIKFFSKVLLDRMGKVLRQSKNDPGLRKLISDYEKSKTR